jgi:hypothetical protein
MLAPAAHYCTHRHMGKRCVVSRVGTLIDKRQPLTPKLHVRMNLHGTYARAPYSELELIHTLFLA